MGGLAAGNETVSDMADGETAGSAALTTVTCLDDVDGVVGGGVTGRLDETVIDALAEKHDDWRANGVAAGLGPGEVILQRHTVSRHGLCLACLPPAEGGRHMHSEHVTREHTKHDVGSGRHCRQSTRWHVVHSNVVRQPVHSTFLHLAHVREGRQDEQIQRSQEPLKPMHFLWRCAAGEGSSGCSKVQRGRKHTEQSVMQAGQSRVSHVGQR